MCKARLHPRANERGSAPVGFVFSALLLLVLFASILQLIMFMHQRSVLIDIVGEAARLGAREEFPVEAGEQRVLELVQGRAHVSGIQVDHLVIGGSQVLRLTVDAHLSLLGMSVEQRVSGHAVVEQAD